MQDFHDRPAYFTTLKETSFKFQKFQEEYEAWMTYKQKLLSMWTDRDINWWRNSGSHENV